MNPTLRNILSVVAGLILGSVVNMGLITVSGQIIPAPEGADVTTMEGLKASIHLFQPKHFIFPFLAHALGTFTGSLVTALVCIRQKAKFAMAIGFFFLAGGIANILMLPSPIWFIAVDLVLAYLPMSYLAGRVFREN
ncbi:hypothetical protein JWG45_07665 [Leptospira sp. 201903070]|uniref:Uncharacterized protein n=1 Tax=Leptospira ainlahdjerensis TaxID=2810033 RepID=A0ABS2U9H4_9LEPT|nr:hypothetical protein [Leptospira ainlahdjerensis]MBM9577030.1 hypothetical protein [Leptospira ainlahdjerensis]